MTLLTGGMMSFKKRDYKTIEEREDAVVGLLNRATCSVDISTGLWSEFYGRPQVVSAFQRAAAKVALCARDEKSFRVLLDSYVDVDAAKADQGRKWLFDLKDEGKIRIRQSGERIQHRIIIDERDFRLESPHDATSGGKSNLIVFNADDSVKDLTDDISIEFDEDWEASREIE